MNKKYMYKDYTYVAFLFLFMSVMILINNLELNKSANPLTFIKTHPSNILLLVVPLLILFIFFVKGYSIKELKEFFKNRFMKLFSRFLSFIITTIAAYFVIFPYKFNDSWDWIIYIIILVSIFFLFAFSWKFEEDKMPPLDKNGMKKMGKYLFDTCIFILLPWVIIFVILYLIFRNLIEAGFIAFIYDFIIISGFSPVMKSKIRLIFGLIASQVLIFLIFNLLRSLGMIIDKTTEIVIMILGIIILIPSVLVSRYSKNKYIINLKNEMYYQ